MKILLVEDDPTIVYALKKALIVESYDVSAAFSMQEAYRMIHKSIDLYILDINLPDGNGLDLAKYIKTKCDTPIVFLSARDDELSINKGFDFGADDYITKPFRISELKRRIETIIKRSNNTVLEYGELRIDLRKASVTSPKETFELSVLEYRLLLLLIQNPDRIFTREALNNELWSNSEYISSNALSVNIKRLRHKLGDSVKIITVHGKGYQIGQ